MTLERRAWNIARVITILLVLVSLRIIYWQMVRGDELKPVAVDLVQAAEEYDRASDGNPADTRSAVDFLTGVSTVKNLESLPQPVIQRTKDLLETITRGAIYDRYGRLLASDRISPDGKRFRFYSEPSLAHAVGYVSGLRTGVAGLELHYNNTLLGLDRPDAQVEQLLNKPITGSDINLTIDSAVQRAAERALEDRTGAVLVLDGKTGAVLAMASQPRFDPNRILEGAYVTELEESCDGSPNCRAPLLNRATQALYPPGSTWKTIPLIAALDTGQVSPDTLFDFGEPVQGGDGLYYIYEVDGGIIPDPNHQERQLNLEMSYAKSANAAFARIGNEMPADVMIDYAARFGFGAPAEFPFPLEIEYTPSQLAQEVKNLYENNLLRAVTAIGQGELLTSPLNIGMIVLSVLNDGDMPLPYLVQSVREPSGSVNEELPNRSVIPDVMKPETAQQVRQMMLSVVEKGSGQKAQVPGLTVGGKTGTAQVGGDLLPHAWFAGFAQDENRSVVVVVLVENGGEGSQAAAPVFAQVVESAMRQAGEPVEEIVPTPVPVPTTTAEAVQETQAPAASTPAATEQTGEGPPTEGPPPEGSPTEGAAETPTTIPSPAETATPVSGSVPPPDIPSDPDKNDLTAANPSCANPRDMPEATGEFIWPSPYQALSGGDFREDHPGLDLSSPPGSPVYAADTGLVIFAGWSGLGYGNAVLIDHGNGFQTLYGHLSQVSIYCGAKVEKGKLIGLSGDTGNSSGPHLHFEVRVPGGYLNPLTVLPVP